MENLNSKSNKSKVKQGVEQTFSQFSHQKIGTLSLPALVNGIARDLSCIKFNEKARINMKQIIPTASLLYSFSFKRVSDATNEFPKQTKYVKIAQTKITYLFIIW